MNSLLLISPAQGSGFKPILSGKFTEHARRLCLLNYRQLAPVCSDNFSRLSGIKKDLHSERSNLSGLSLIHQFVVRTLVLYLAIKLS